MSRKPRTTLTSVEKLIEQRRLFQDWMEKLSSTVEGMPPHVVERVRNDYRDRLAGVMTELGEHRDGLREALNESQERHDGLDDQHQAKKDELAELRLRRHVGEMDDGRFKEQSGELQGVIDQIKKDLGAALRDIERYEEILEVIAEGDKPAPAPEPEPEPEPVVAAKPAEKAPEPKVEAKPEPKAEEKQEPEPVPAPAEPARGDRKSSPDVKVPADELAFLRSVTSSPVLKVPQDIQQRGNTKIQPAAKAPAAAPAPAEPARKKEPAAESVDVAFEAAPGLMEMPQVTEAEPAAPAKAAPAPAKDENAGLTCGECGAANRPTEWYCEKCGAELAAY